MRALGHYEVCNTMCQSSKPTSHLTEIITIKKKKRILFFLSIDSSLAQQHVQAKNWMGGGWMRSTQSDHKEGGVTKRWSLKFKGFWSQSQGAETTSCLSFSAPQEWPAPPLLFHWLGSRTSVAPSLQQSAIRKLDDQGGRLQAPETCGAGVKVHRHDLSRT